MFMICLLLFNLLFLVFNIVPSVVYSMSSGIKTCVLWCLIPMSFGVESCLLVFNYVSSGVLPCVLSWVFLC